MQRNGAGWCGLIFGPFRKLAETQFFLLKIDVHQELLENIGPDQAFLPNHRTVLQDLHGTVLKLEVANLDGAGHSDVTAFAALVSDAADTGFHQSSDASFLGGAAVDENTAGTGVKHQP